MVECEPSLATNGSAGSAIVSFSFCPKCGNRLDRRLIETEDRPRLICQGCRFILYENPKVVVGALPIVGNKVMLLRRGIEPRYGSWSYPGGFMELDESVEEAAIRETHEEMNLEIRIDRLLNVYSRPGIGIVTVIYLATVIGGEPRLTSEAIEIQAFAPEEIPWHDLAFPTTHQALQAWAGLVSYSTGSAPHLPRP